VSQATRSEQRTGDAGGTPLAIRMAGPGGSDVVVSANLRAVPIALVITVLHGLLTWWRLSRSWFWQDDLNLLATAADEPLGGLLFSDYNGHLVPASWLTAWLSNHVSALSWAPVAAVLLVLVVATDLALLGALLRLFGPRPAILVPYTIFCASTLTLTATVWWAAAMQWMPTALALALALYFHAGYVARPNARDLFGALAAVALGLLCFEKALTIPVVLALLTVAYFVPGPLWKRPWRAFRRYPLFWVAQGLLSGGYLWLYLDRVAIEPGEAATGGEYADLVGNMLLRTYLPGLLGGPLDWVATPSASLVSWSMPPVWLEWLSWLVAAVVILGSTLLIRGAWRAWAILAVFLAISVTLVARARLGLVGPFIGRDHRYLTDAALLGVVCLSLALIPLRPGLDRALHGDPPPEPEWDEDEDEDEQEWPEPAPDPEVDGVAEEPGEEDRADGEDDDGIDRTPIRHRVGRRRAVWTERAQARMTALGAWPLIGGAGVMAVVTVGGILSSEQYLKTWELNPAPAYFEKVELSLADPSQPHPLFMFDQELPPLIMTPTFGEDRMFSHVMKLFGDDAPVFGWWSPRFVVADEEGRLRPGAVAGQVAVPPNGLVCSAKDDPQQGVALTLPAPPPEWNWKVELTYSADQDTAARVRYGEGPAVPLRLTKGLNKVVVSVTGAGPAITVTDLTPGTTVCLGRAVVGLPVPDPTKPVPDQ
jgi:hypothetical protein